MAQDTAQDTAHDMNMMQQELFSKLLEIKVEINSVIGWLQSDFDDIIDTICQSKLDMQLSVNELKNGFDHVINTLNKLKSETVELTETFYKKAN